MSWLGKVIGGTIGFALGGPLGAVAGAVFGHSFDRSDPYDNTGGYSGLTYGQEPQLTFFVASFSMLAKLTKVDGRISEEEIDSIENFMIRDLGLNAASREAAVNIFKQATVSRDSFEDYAVQFYNTFRNQPQIIELMIDILLRVALSDGRFSENEERLLLSAARIFNLSSASYERIKSRYAGQSDNYKKYYDILKCSTEDSVETIKRQYRKLVAEYHPDKIAAKGLPEEFTQFAGEKFREIQTAYETIKQQRGIK